MNNLIPHFIAKKYTDGILSGDFYAVTMFLDISGFTPMTETLVKNGKEGTEILSEILNRIFEPVIDAIYAAGGFVSVFAGDALSAVFISKTSSSDLTAAGAIGCAFEIKGIFGRDADIDTKFGRFKLSVKIGMSAGDVEWRIIKNDIQNSYYFSGRAVSSAAVCERHCDSGEIVIDRELFSGISPDKILREKSRGYYTLKPDFNYSPDYTGLKTLMDIDSAVIKKFAPEAIINFKARGEFRNIASCFISFKPQGNISDYINKLVSLSNQYGGYFNCLDFGDKGGMIFVIFGAPSGLEKLFERSAAFAQDIIGLSKNNGLFPLRAALTFGAAFTGYVGSKKRGEYTALGATVNLSARMAAGAEWGELLIDSKFHRNLGENFETSSPLEMKFKGIEGKTPVYKLTSRKDRPSAYSTEAKLIGREKELSLILKYIEAVKDNKFAGVVYIDGAAGSGKTRFLGEVKPEISGRGYNWFYMPCDGILQKSFNPFIHFLKNYFNQSSAPDKRAFENKLNELISKAADPELSKELAGASSFLGAMIGLSWKNSRFETSDSRARYNNTLYAVKALIKAETLLKPVVIEIEDGHWIDKDSIALLKILTRNVEGYPFIIISQCRYNDDGGSFSFGLKDVPQKRIAINSLDERSTKLLTASKIVEKAAAEIPRKTIDFIFERSGGNPFYIEQIINYLKENALLDSGFNLSRAHFEIPSGISSIIIARLDRLAFELKETARTASVLGHTFAVNILLSMLDKLNIVKSNEFKKQLGEGEKQLLWETLSEIKYIFKHSLIRESIYSMQLKKHLRILHELAGEAIESLHPNNLNDYFGELANHYENAENFDKAKIYLQKAAELAVKNYHNSPAVAYYDRLLKILNVEEIKSAGSKKAHIRDLLEKREGVLCEKGKIFEVTGDWDEAEKTFSEALKLSLRLRDKKRTANAYLYCGIIASCKGNFKGALKYLFKSLKLYESLRDSCGVSKVAGHMGYIYLSVSELDKSIERFNKKLIICRRRGDKLGVSHAIGNLGIIYFRLGKNDRALKCYEKQLRISEKLGDKRTISAAIGNIGTIHLVNGRYGEALKCYLRQKKIALLLGNRISVGVAVGNIGAINFMEGRYKKSLAYFEEHLKMSREIGDKYGMAISTGNLGEVYRILKNYEKSEAYLKDAIRIKTEINALFYLCQSFFCMAELYYDMKKLNSAAQFCVKALKTARDSQNNEHIFKARLLGLKIKFEDCCGVKEKYNVIRKLSDMLAGEKNMANIAALNYELYRMYSAMADDKKNAHEKKAISIYKKLYLKLPDFEYKQRIEEMEKIQGELFLTKNLSQ